MTAPQPIQIKIARPGTFTSVEGKDVTFTRRDFEDAIEAYDPKSDPAPLVIGHPRLEDPAYGWVERLKFIGDDLAVEAGDVEPAFAEAVNAGRYRKVSAQWYLPTHPHNPRPGRLSLKHVGFLGAAAPGVKGLGTVSFSEGDDAHDVVDTVTPKKEAQMADTPNTDQNDALAQREADLNAREAAIGQRETNVQTREQEAERRAQEATHAGSVSFAEAQVAAGRLAPAGRDLVVGLLDTLAGAEPPSTALASFGEGEARLEPAAAFRKLFEGARPVVSFGEAAPAEGGDEDAAATASFAAPPGYSADPKSLAIHNKALALQAANSGLSYTDAVRQAQGG